jgi:hypothetical protein
VRPAPRGRDRRLGPVKTAVAGVLAVIWVALLVAVSLWIWQRSRKVGLDEKRARDRRRAERDRQRPERELERAVREATSHGGVVVVARRGHDPTRVFWSDGGVWFYFRDDDQHEAARQRGLVPPGTTCMVGEAPLVGAPRPPT